jgi:hypothetical protein
LERHPRAQLSPFSAVQCAARASAAQRPHHRSPGIEFIRYDESDHDDLAITLRAGGGRIAWFQDPDGTTIAIEADR